MVMPKMQHPEVLLFYVAVILAAATLLAEILQLRRISQGLTTAISILFWLTFLYLLVTLDIGAWVLLAIFIAIHIYVWIEEKKGKEKEAVAKLPPQLVYFWMLLQMI